MNEYDSEKVLALLSRDYSPVATPEQAQLIFVNTCAVREKGEHKLFSLLGELRDLKAISQGMIVGVGGCVAQQEGASIMKRSPAVDFVVGTHNLSLVPSLVEQAREGQRGMVAVDYREDWESLPEVFDTTDENAFEGWRGAFQSPVRAYVAIQRGCNKKCAFCVVPTTRGPEVSRPAAEILREVKAKVLRGAKEVMLLGQTVNSYGKDLEPRYPFEKLIQEIAALDGVERIRFTSPHPQEVKPEFIALYKDVPQLCPWIHLPLQSGSDRILKLMNRNYRTARYLKIIDELRAGRPDIAISSDFIVGFPTESPADFNETLQIIERVGYHASYSFKYSERPNTTAKLDFSAADYILKAEAENRLAQLQGLQERISGAINANYLGTKSLVLVEGGSPNVKSLMRGRTPQNILVEVSGGSPKVGDTVEVSIDHTGPYGLRGVLTH